MADVDNDGDLDLMYTDQKHKKIFFYQNIGNSTSPVFHNYTGTAIDPFKNIVFFVSNVVEPYFAIAFIDVDSDGDLDMVSSDYSGKFYYYKNIGHPLQLLLLVLP
jgi:hypothetical protein